MDNVFECFHDLLRFGSFYVKRHKIGDFRDLLLEGPFFIVRGSMKCI